MKLKEKPSDFIVKEELRESPKERGRGKYRYYLLFKRSLETKESLREIARLSGIREGELLYGGLKDKNAETYQYVAVKEDLRLKEVERKNLSLKFVGFSDLTPSENLLGNHFFIKVKGVKEPPQERIEVLTQFGLPNYYGEQRFTSVRSGDFFVLKETPEEKVKYLFTPASWEGSRQRKAKKLFLEGRYKEASEFLKGWQRRVALYLSRGGSFEGALNLIPKEEVEFQINVFQSFLFNLLLSSLVKESGAPLLRFKYKLGWLYYPLKKVELPLKLPIYAPGKKEYRGLLRELSIGESKLRRYLPYFHNFSRKTFVKPKNFTLTKGEGEVLVGFFLPKGSYATNLLRFLFSATK
ncbi:tRNA pseudouridine(13) synthase TruD [Thermovibrio sp.]